MTEIIGHMESEEGTDLGELVIVNRARGRGRPKLKRRKNKFTCNLCNKGFLQRSRYIMHKCVHKIKSVDPLRHFYSQFLIFLTKQQILDC